MRVRDSFRRMTEGSLPFDGNVGTGPPPNGGLGDEPQPDRSAIPPAEGSPVATKARRRLGLAFVLIFLCIVFGGIAAWILPNSTAIQQPLPFSVQVGDALHPASTGDIGVTLSVVYPRPDVSGLGLYLGGNLSGKTVLVTIYLPQGVTVNACHGTYRPATKGEVCRVGPSGIAHFIEAQLTLPVKGVDSGSPSAEGAIEVSADHLGYASDGVNAEVAIPTVNTPSALDGIAVGYEDIPDAASFDWSANSAQLQDAGSHGASWTISPSSSAILLPTATDVSGINHDAQKRQNLDFFISGALIALAGAALIGAAQETYHGWSSSPRD